MTNEYGLTWVTVEGVVKDIEGLEDGKLYRVPVDQLGKVLSHRDTLHRFGYQFDLDNIEWNATADAFEVPIKAAE